MICELDIPIYSNKIILTTDPNEFEQLQSKHGCIELEYPIDHYRGLTQHYYNNEPSLVLLVGVFDRSIRTLVHELGHAALQICEDKGFNPHDGNGEPFLYLLDYLVDYFEKKVVDKK